MKTSLKRHLLATVPCAVITLLAGPTALRADDAKPAATWASGITFGVQAEAGFTAAAGSPHANTGGNFGQLFTDKPNTGLINQVAFTVARTIDPKETGWDVGFKLQLMGGSDARYTHFMGELDRASTSRYQYDVVEANVTVHAPVLTEGGVDLKLGQYSTPLGLETIDPSTNPFYSHSYIFNFGLPLKHTGGLAIVHATDMIDVYAGLDTGVNTSFGKGDNNGAIGGIGGLQLTLLEGKLTVLALSHIGPENPKRLVPNADKYLRYFNDAVITFKASEALTLTTEINYARDDLAKADAGGVAQYIGYALTSEITLNGRAEIYADKKNFFVGAFPGNLDFVNAERGYPATVISAAKATTFGSLTAGFTWKPESFGPTKTMMIRPELRYDTALNSSKPFNNGKDKGALTLASDIVIGF